MPTLLYGSVARLHIQELDARLPEFTVPEQKQNRFTGRRILARFSLRKARTRFVANAIYITEGKPNVRSRLLGDLKVGNGDASLTM